MKIIVKTIGGGIFSKFMVAIDSIIHNIEDVNSIDSIYIEVDRSRTTELNQRNLHINPFNFILEQDASVKFDLTIVATVKPVYTDIINHKNYNKLSIICKKLRVKDTILYKIQNLDKNTLGVHVRLTDMNTCHPQYGIATTQHYINHIQTIMDNNPHLTKIFVASDNNQSISILREKFDIIYINVNNRSETEKGDGYLNFLMEQSGEEQFWIDSMVEMLSLSKCEELLYKVSNLNNFSVLFSNTIQKTHKLKI